MFAADGRQFDVLAEQVGPLKFGVWDARFFIAASRADFPGQVAKRVVAQAVQTFGQRVVGHPQAVFVVGIDPAVSLHLPPERAGRQR